ncbi:MAG: DedA family protein [Thermodesulfovibrionales bacterium]
MLLESFVKTYGYWALLIGTFLEGETILIIGGITAHLGYLDLPKVMMIAFIGSFTGDQVYFCIGRLKGRNLIEKHPRWQSRVDKVHLLLRRYHDVIMIGFRFIYGMRIMTPFVLGMSKNIKTLRFVVFNALGAMIWAVVISWGGYLFGYAIENVIKDVRRYQLEVMLVVASGGLILWGIHAFKERKRK